MTALYITIAAFVGFAVGIAAGYKFGNKRVAELKKEVTIQRNVVKSLDEDNIKLRKRLKKKGYDTDDRDN